MALVVACATEMASQVGIDKACPLCHARPGVKCWVRGTKRHASKSHTSRTRRVRGRSRRWGVGLIANPILTMPLAFMLLLFGTWETTLIAVLVFFHASVSILDLNRRRRGLDGAWVRDR